MKLNPRTFILGLVLLAGVGYLVWSSTRKSTEDRPPDTAESITHWMCDKCGQELDLTARQMDDWMKDDTRIRLGDKQNRRQIVFKCDKCRTFTVCRATFCRVHNLWFVDERSDGTSKDCPKCPAGG